MLDPLIPEPRNKKQRKAAHIWQAAADAQYLEVQRLGAMIGQLDLAREYLLSTQLRLARELALAGVPMDGVVRK